MKRKAPATCFRAFLIPRSARKTAGLLLVLFLLSNGCTPAGKEGPVARAPRPTVIRGTEVEIVKTVLMPQTVEVPGTVRARTSAVVSPRIAGTVKQLRVREGQRVRRGDLLAVLDAGENLANAAVARAAADEAEKAVEEAVARKKLTDATFGRYQKLFSEQAVTRQEFDVQTREKELAALGVARAGARLKQAQEALKAADVMAGYTKITAPISGVVTSRQANLGGSVFPAQPLLTIEDEASYQLELSLPESVAAKTASGLKVQVTLEALGLTFDARINEIVPAADPGSRTVVAKIALEQKDLKSGMFGRAMIDLGTTEKGLFLPVQALRKRGGLTSVWVVGSDRLARMRLVKPGRVIGNRVEILSGISEGEHVIVTGVADISEGSRIE